MVAILFVIFVCWLILGFFISRSDTRTGLIPTAMSDIPIFILVFFWAFVLNLYSFYVFFTILILLYLFFDIVQHLLFKKYNKTIGTGDIKLYLLIFCLFPSSFGTHIILWHPFIFMFVLSLLFLVSMIFVKLIYITYLDRLPKLFQVLGTNAISTEIRFAPVIYISSIICFITYFIIVL